MRSGNAHLFGTRRQFVSSGREVQGNLIRFSFRNESANNILQNAKKLVRRWSNHRVLAKLCLCVQTSTRSASGGHNIRHISRTSKLLRYNPKALWFMHPATVVKCADLVRRCAMRIERSFSGEPEKSNWALHNINSRFSRIIVELLRTMFTIAVPLI